MELAKKFSSITTDPLRGYRFYAKFSAPSGDTTDAFDGRIRDAASSVKREAATATGFSTGFVGGFTQIGGLQMNVQDIPYREGGFNVTAHHMPGLVTFSPVVFQRGVLWGNDQAITWMRGMIEVASGKGLNYGTNTLAKNFRVNVEIFAADSINTAETLVPRMGWKLNNAWISNLAYTDMNSVSNEVVFETMTLVHEGMEVFFYKPDGSVIDDKVVEAARKSGN